MTNAKNTKRALVSSLLALVLCVSMLVGSTYAWFTDTATAGVNTIQSGTLDIDIVDVEGNSLSGDTLEFVKSASAPADEALLWEPGCTYYLEGFKIVNKGNLDAKCKIVINGLDGDSLLLEAIDFYLSADTAWDKETDTKLSSTSTTLGTDIEVMAGETTDNTYYIIGHMKEEAGNEYQNLKLEGISITVYATQLASEYDSYNNQYDAGADYVDNIPVAKVVSNGAQTGLAAITDMQGNGATTINLDCSYTFYAPETAAEAGNNPYATWLCDYVISFDKDVVDGAYVAGQYDGWKAGLDQNWLYFSAAGKKANEEIRLLATYLPEYTFTYVDICALVKEFDCGAFDNGANEGTTMTVALRIYNPENPDNYLTIGEYTYTF